MTGSPSRRSVEVVTDAAAAAVLVSAAHRRFLGPFLGRERSTAEVARELGETTERTAYRVRQLVSRGLLSPVRSLTRKGRSITVYTAAAELRAPLTLLPEADIAHLFDVMDAEGRAVLLAALARLAARSGVMDWSVRVHRGGDDQILVDMVSPQTETEGALLSPHAPSVVFHWVPVAMDDASAKALQRRMTDLVADLPVSTSAPTHLAGLFLAPLTG